MNGILKAVALLGFFIQASPAQIMNLQALAERADAVVVGRISQVVGQPWGAVFGLAVVRTVHGELAPGAILNVTARFRRDQRTDPGREVLGECSLVLLARASGGWEAVGAGNSPFLRDSVIDLGGCEAPPQSTPEAASVYEKTFVEVALAAARSSGSVGPRLVDLAGSSDSPIVTKIMREFSASSDPGLRAEALAWWVGRGEAAALVELTSLVLARPNPDPQGSFTSALYVYAGNDAKGIAALGRLVSGTAPQGRSLRRSAAHALRNIHTRDAVPFLAGMLDSADPEMRMEAVSGLTEHVMGVRPVADGPERQRVLDQVFNPSQRKAPPLSVDPQYLHMGFFDDKDQEARIVNYWRQWWQANKGSFPAAPSR